MSGEPITSEEMVEMFGSAMPIEAVQLVWNADGSKTVGEIRDDLRALAARRKQEAPDIVERLIGYKRSAYPEDMELHETAGRAADEIERLRAALKTIADGYIDVGGNRRVRFDSCAVARDALEKKP